MVHICGSMPLVVMCLFERILEYPAARLILHSAYRCLSACLSARVVCNACCITIVLGCSCATNSVVIVVIVTCYAALVAIFSAYSSTLCGRHTHRDTYRVLTRKCS